MTREAALSHPASVTEYWISHKPAMRADPPLRWMRYREPRGASLKARPPVYSRRACATTERIGLKKPHSAIGRDASSSTKAEGRCATSASVGGP